MLNTGSPLKSMDFTFGFLAEDLTAPTALGVPSEGILSRYSLDSDGIMVKDDEEITFKNYDPSLTADKSSFVI